MNYAPLCFSWSVPESLLCECTEWSTFKRTCIPNKDRENAKDASHRMQGCTHVCLVADEKNKYRERVIMLAVYNFLQA